MSDDRTTAHDAPAVPEAAGAGAFGADALPGGRSAQNYWQIVWGQFRKRRLPMLGLAMVVLLFLLAVFAPIFLLAEVTNAGLFLPLFWVDLPLVFGPIPPVPSWVLI